MKVKVKFLKEYQDLFVPGELSKVAPEVAKFLVEEGFAEVIEEVKPKAKPKPAPKK